MLFLVIERFRDTGAIGKRFRTQGRMLPDRVAYIDSWIDPGGSRCFQIMEAPSAEHLNPWISAWEDLAEFEVIPVQTSREFWAGYTAQG